MLNIGPNLVEFLSLSKDFEKHFGGHPTPSRNCSILTSRENALCICTMKLQIFWQIKKIDQPRPYESKEAKNWKNEKILNRLAKEKRSGLFISPVTRNSFLTLTPRKSVATFIWLCHWSSIGKNAQEKDSISSKESIDPAQVEKLHGQDINKSPVDDVGDACQGVANEWVKDERFPSKDIREGAGNHGEKDEGDGRYPARVHLETDIF